MNENTVEYLGHYGGDVTHAMSAWTSTRREMTPERMARIPHLLRGILVGRADTPCEMCGNPFDLDHGPPHTTPFEKSTLHFLLTTDVATHIHLLKHRIGVSVNAESARYKELTDKHYLPSDWPEDMRDDLDQQVKEAFRRYHNYVEALEAGGMSRARAKESARFILPYSTQITQDVMFNFVSFMHFQNLRNDPHAQLEVREVAQQMLSIVVGLGDFEHSLAAYGYYLDHEPEGEAR